jgi:DNA polymerase-1
MLALIDSDTLAYASAVMAEGQGEQIAIWNANYAIESLLRDINTSNNNEYQLYLTGENNFRYNVYPEYKANRIKMQRPTYLPAVRQHMMEKWGAFMSEGCEADDMLGVDAHQADLDEREVLLVHIDKDIDQIPGKHYNPRKKTTYYVSPIEGLRFFYYQLLVGDSADHIKGAKGIGPKKAEKILEGLTSECDLLNAVRNYYSSDEELLMNGQCLWLWRTMGDTWQIPQCGELSNETTETSSTTI